ncbi:hypothetical protein [Longimicrobium sp.]|uniref:hypothetical protein n=1 Tax=Longimicrobium sp. TaxID=2029185 RepID=UPI002E33B9CF|nr:hypothetical protein [Longimicrobium sp.]HEX6038327.1 hypothetical protein [Longimicrobium sp.]
MRFALVLALCAALLPRAGHAQFRDQLYTSPVAALPVEAGEPVPTLAILLPDVAGTGEPAVSVPLMVLGGLAGNTAGVLVGLVLGSGDAGQQGEDCMDLCLGTWGVISLLASTTVGTTLGVHLGNFRRGSLPLSLLASTAIVSVGYALATRDPDVFIAVPLGQLAGSVLVELATTPRP